MLWHLVSLFLRNILVCAIFLQIPLFSHFQKKDNNKFREYLTQTVMKVEFQSEFSPQRERDIISGKVHFLKAIADFEDIQGISPFFAIEKIAINEIFNVFLRAEFNRLGNQCVACEFVAIFYFI